MLFEVGFCNLEEGRSPQSSSFAHLNALFPSDLKFEVSEKPALGADDKSCYIKINAWRCTGIHRKETQRGLPTPRGFSLIMIFKFCNQDQLGLCFSDADMHDA